MSIEISIKDNGVAENLTIDKLNVPTTGNSTEDWEPISGENINAVKVKTGENGTVNASDFDAYGISEITVEQTGKKPTSAADEKTMGRHETKITVGGKSRIIKAKKLRVNLNGGGICDLAASRDIALATLTVNTPGLYRASDSNAFGFSAVTVNFPSGGESGKEGGWDQAFDGEGLPAYIRITSLPSGGSYQGLVVKAYQSNGSIWSNSLYPGGIIPLDELEIEKGVMPNYDADALRSFFGKSILSYGEINSTYTYSRTKSWKNDEWPYYVQQAEETETCTWELGTPARYCYVQSGDSFYIYFFSREEQAAYDVFGPMTAEGHVYFLFSEGGKNQSNITRYGWPTQEETKTQVVEALPWTGYLINNKSSKYYRQNIRSIWVQYRNVVSGSGFYYGNPELSFECSPSTPINTGASTGLGSIEAALTYNILYAPEAIMVSWARPGDGVVLSDSAEMGD